jgi:hypothetical protein
VLPIRAVRAGRRAEHARFGGFGFVVEEHAGEVDVALGRAEVKLAEPFGSARSCSRCLPRCQSRALTGAALYNGQPTA